MKWAQHFTHVNSIVKTIYFQYSRADIKHPTHAVPHGAAPEIADGSSHMERPAAKDCSAKSPPSDRKQSLPGSLASVPPSNGTTDDADESTLVLGDDV